MEVDEKKWNEELARLERETARRHGWGKKYWGDLRREGCEPILARAGKPLAVVPIWKRGLPRRDLERRNEGLIAASVRRGLRPVQLVAGKSPRQREALREPALLLPGPSGQSWPDFRAQIVELLQEAQVPRALASPGRSLLLISAEGAEEALSPQLSAQAIEAGFARLQEGRREPLRILGSTGPQNSISALAFERIGLGY